MRSQILGRRKQHGGELLLGTAVGQECHEVGRPLHVRRAAQEPVVRQLDLVDAVLDVGFNGGDDLGPRNAGSDKSGPGGQARRLGLAIEQIAIDLMDEIL